MKPLHVAGTGIVGIGALVGFSIVWQAKPSTRNSPSGSVPTVQTRVERRPIKSHSLGSAAPSEFFRRWDEVEEDVDCGLKRKALLEGLGPAEFPALLAEMFDKAALTGLETPDYDGQLCSLFKAWYAKVPEEAVVWLCALPKALERRRFLYVIVEEVANTDFDRAVSMLRRDGADLVGYRYIPDKLIEKAVELGEDKLLEVCKLGLHRGGVHRSYTCQMSYPNDFDFRRVLDGLAVAQAEMGAEWNFSKVPGNLIKEWAKRDFQGAWAWLREGKTVMGNRKSDLIESLPPAEAGALLAADFDPNAPGDKRYLDAVSEIDRGSSREKLDAFLQAAPGERAVHLGGLFDTLRGGHFGEFQRLLLERMSLEEQSEAVLRNFKDGTDQQTRSTLAQLLSSLGHSEEEIQSLLPERKD